MQLEGGSGILRALSYYYYNGYAAVAALAGASFENVANMTRPQCDLYIPRPSLEEESVVYRN